MQKSIVILSAAKNPRISLLPLPLPVPLFVIPPAAHTGIAAVIPTAAKYCSRHPDRRRRTLPP
jgi:hypothetical protein